MLNRIQKIALGTYLYASFEKEDLFALIGWAERVLNRLMPLIALTMWAFGR